MSVLTESELRKMMSEGVVQEKGFILLDKDTIITPSARTFLTEKNIHFELCQEKEEKIAANIEKETLEKAGIHMQEKKEKKEEVMYETLFGAKLFEKPEHMTHLRGNLLVFKDHPRIRLRGAIDKLESEIILLQTICMKYIKNNTREERKIEIKDVSGNTINAISSNYQMLIDDLEEIIQWIRTLLRYEITGEAVENFTLQGLDEEAIHEQSYHPSKYFGIKHFLPTYQHGEIVAYLNGLRTKTRETELIAFQAFQDEHGQMSRVDIIKAFNRLSSLFWIMMFKWLSGKYQ